MAKLIASRTAQYPLVAEFEFNFDDTMKTVAGAVVDFGKTNIASSVFEVMNVPQGAVIIGGEVVTETAFDAATYTISVGDSASATRYLGATDRKATGRSALVPTGYRTEGRNVRITVEAADVCTTGKATVRIQYVIKDRAQEVCTA
jgi:hypothetical protein